MQMEPAAAAPAAARKTGRARGCIGTDRDTLQCTPPCCLPSSDGERARLSQKTPWRILAAFPGLHEPTVRVPIACMAAAMERRESYVQPAVLTADDIISKKNRI